MKWFDHVLIFLLPLLCVGCADDVASAGAGALDDSDQIRVCASELGDIVSHTDSLANFTITQTPDSFLLGECNTDSWATIKADLLSQFACPVGVQFPDSSMVDSVALVMTYSSWFGDGNSPLRLSIYELDKATFDYDGVYSSGIDLNTYWSGDPATHAVETDRTIVAAQNTDTVYSSELKKYLPYVRFRMNERIVNKMNEIKKFPSQKEFNNFFKGLYITSTYGSATALYVDNVTMIIYYHYYYQSEKGGEWLCNNDAKYLYANSEVRQVNRYSFPYKQVVVSALQEMEDSFNYVISPAYVYTVLTIPMGEYVNQVNDSVLPLRPYFNKALMRVDLPNVEIKTASYANRWASPATNMLLICKDSLQNFFQESKLPDADYCLFSTLAYDVDSAYQHHYYYQFDLSTILQNALRSNQQADVDMVMIPVDVEYTTTTSSTTVISKVKINQTITFTELRSAQFILDPMDIDAVYSGFSINNMY